MFHSLIVLLDFTTVLPLTMFMVPFVLSFLLHLTFFLMSFNSGSLIVYYKWCQVIRINTVVLKTIVNGGCYLKQVIKLKKLKLVLETIFEQVFQHVSVY